MKLILMAIFVFFFVALPLYMLNALLMPALSSVQHTYSQAGTIADRVANGR